jgi:tRNA(Ile)-lysidine synthase
MARTAAHCGQAEALLAEYVAEDMQRLLLDDASLCLKRLSEYSAPRQIAIVRAFVQHLGLPLPSAVKLQHLFSDLIEAAVDAEPTILWGGVVVKRYQDRMFAFPPLPPHDASKVMPLSADTEKWLPNSLHIPVGSKVTVRFRQGGEVVRLPGRGSRSLKKLLHEWGVYPWMRDRVPLIYVDESLAAVSGYAVDERYSGSERII